MPAALPRTMRFHQSSDGREEEESFPFMLFSIMFLFWRNIVFFLFYTLRPKPHSVSFLPPRPARRLTAATKFGRRLGASHRPSERRETNNKKKKGSKEEKKKKKKKNYLVLLVHTKSSSPLERVQNWYQTFGSTFFLCLSVGVMDSLLLGHQSEALHAFYGVGHV